MTIHQLKDRCWELQPPLDDDRNPHYDNEAAALDALDEARDEAGDKDHLPDPATKPVQLASPCWLVQCDGECETVIDEEGEGYTFHHDSAADAGQTVVGYRWAFAGDGRVFCEDDAPADAAVPLSRAEQEAAGQLVLPGVAP